MAIKCCEAAGWYCQAPSNHSGSSIHNDLEESTLDDLMFCWTGKIVTITIHNGACEKIYVF